MSSPWKPELDAIVGARHGGAGEVLVKRLQDLDARHPNVPEICHQVAWSLEVLGRAAESLPWYEKAIMLGLSPNEHSTAVLGQVGCLRALGRPQEAAAILQGLRTQFPENREYDAFLALCQWDLGQKAEAVRTLMDVLVETTEDFGIRAAQRNLRHQASRLADQP